MPLRVAVWEDRAVPSSEDPGSFYPHPSFSWFLFVSMSGPFASVWILDWASILLFEQVF